MDKKTKYIIIALAVIVILYFVAKGKKKEESQESSSLKSIAKTVTANMASIGTASAVNKSEEDEEYQNLLDQLQSLNGNVLPSGARTWTANQIRRKIKELQALQEAWLDYAAAEEDESKQESAAALAARGIDTVAEIQQLTREVKARNQREKLQSLLDAFIITCNNYGSIWHPAGAKQQQWDVSTLNAIMALPLEDLKVLNSMFKERKEDCNYPDNYSALSYRYYVRTSLSNAIPNGTLCSYRSGSDVAKKFKQEMESKGC